MIESVSFRREFESEAEIAIAQLDTGGRLGLFLTPFRQFLQLSEHSHLLSFSIARHCGATPKTAFFLEWAHLSFELPKDYSLLYKTNRRFLQSVVPPAVSLMPQIVDYIDQDAANSLITEQMKFVYQRFIYLRQEVINKQPFLTRFFDESIFAKVTASELFLRRPLYTQSPTVADFLEYLTYSSSFLSITLPALAGFATIFSRENSDIATDKIKWAQVESICKSISVLYQLRHNVHARVFLRGKLYEADQYTRWLSLSLQEQEDIALKDDQISTQIDDIAHQIQDRATAELSTLAFPATHKDTLTQLLSWAYSDESDEGITAE